MPRSLMTTVTAALALGLAGCAASTAASTAVSTTTATGAPAAAAPIASQWVPRAEPPAPAAGRRINRAIEVLASGQPIYYTQASGGGYEDGLRLASTQADYITYEMEHGAFSLTEL